MRREAVPVYDETLFLDPAHEENFLSLLCLDNTCPSDQERLALFFIIAGNWELFSKRERIYDFREHCLQRGLDSNGLCLSSGISSLLVLGRNLYNGYVGGDTSPLHLFWDLDADNAQLAVNALRMRFL